MAARNFARLLMVKKPSLVVIAAVSVCLSNYKFGFYRNQQLKLNLYCDDVVDKLVFEEPYTKRKIDKYVNLNGKEYVLVGCGVRRVTFLRIAVYIASIYKLQDSRITNTGDLKAIVKDPYLELAVRVQPLRDTNGPHLRKGFMQRLLDNIAQITESPDKAAAKIPFSAAEAKLASDALPKLQQVLTQPLIKADQCLTFIKKKNTQNLYIELDGRQLAEIDAPALSQMFLWTYLNPENPISEPLLNSFKSDGLKFAA